MLNWTLGVLSQVLLLLPFRRPVPVGGIRMLPLTPRYPLGLPPVIHRRQPAGTIPQYGLLLEEAQRLLLCHPQHVGVAVGGCTTVTEIYF